jgi:hypothetical protein
MLRSDERFQEIYFHQNPMKHGDRSSSGIVVLVLN